MEIHDILLGGIVVFALIVVGVVFLVRKKIKAYQAGGMFEVSQTGGRMFKAYQEGARKGAAQGATRVLFGMTAKNIRTVISKMAYTIYYSREKSLGKDGMSTVDNITKDLEGFFDRECRQHFLPDEMEILTKISRGTNEEIDLDKLRVFSSKFQSICKRILEIDLAEYVYKKYGVNVEKIVKEND